MHAGMIGEFLQLTTDLRGRVQLFERSEGPMLSGSDSVIGLAIAVYDLSE